MDNLAPVTLVVKAPNQKIGDQTIECALDWTVKKLKQHLSSVYPSKPTETQQRIIYSGRLLQDDVQLKDVLRQHEPDQLTHTVHLVCSPSTTDAFSPTVAASQPRELAGSSSTEGLRHRHTAVSSAVNSQQVPLPPTYSSVMSNSLQYSVSNPMTYPGYPGMMMPGSAAGPGFISPMYTPEQMVWLQQSYAQYMAQYMQFYQPGFYPHQPGFYQQQIPVPPNEPVPNVPANQQRANAPQAEAAAANGRRRPEIVRMNAQGGPLADDDDDDEMRNRDWLDWVYTFIRFMLLLCILYFYSSFDRFIATMALVIVVYLYQAGWFRIHQRNPAGREDVAVPEPMQPQNNHDDLHPQAADDNEPLFDGDVNDEMTQPVAAAAEANGLEPGHHGILSLGWTFIVSFFSSLAPQQPPPVNAN